LATAVLQLAVAIGAVAAAPVLTPGDYTVQLITDPTSTTVAFDCFYGFVPEGGSGVEGQTTVLSYPGLGKTGGTLNTALAYSNSEGPSDSVAGVFAVTYALPAVPATGPSSWAGTYTAAFHGIPSKNGRKLPLINATSNGAVTLNLTPLSTKTFTGTISFVPSGTTTTCLLWVSGVLP
jgi:hypothetical protein